MANSAAFWRFPAQRRSIRQQLDHSMRAVMLEVQNYGGKPMLCLRDCAFGRSALVPELTELRAFLADNPRDVVTLLVDNHVPAEDFAVAVEAAQLSEYLFDADTSTAWPTLGEMIAIGRRLVIFLSEPAGATAGYRSLSGNIVATGDQFQTSRDLDCEVAQGSVKAPMYLVNHFLVTANGDARPTGEIAGAAGAANVSNAAIAGGGSYGGSATTGHASETLAESVNRDPFLSERLARCRATFGKVPNFVAVDFYDTSDVIGATQRLNGLVP